MKQPIIQFTDFTFKYRSQIEPTLNQINLTIYKGEKVVIVGPSGSGKSTLAHCLNGLVPFSYEGESTGTLHIKGKPQQEYTIFDLSKVVGTVLQDADGQFVGLSVGEDMAFILENDCIEQVEMKRRVEEVADRLELTDKLTASLHELSGGQRQRAAIGGVIIDEVEVLLFDEPLANLDPATGKQAMQLIETIHQQTGATVVMIEHRLEDVLHRDVDRIIVMDHGHLIADMAPNELLSNSILEKTFIREPLYLKAAKFAGCTIVPEMHPAHLTTFDLRGQEELIRKWATSSPEQLNEPLGTPLFVAEELSFGYDDKRLQIQDLSLSIYPGEMVAIVGQNGAGKSTLGKLLGGFEKVQNGRILHREEDVTNDSIKQRAERVGVVMQNPNHMLSKHMIFDEVAFGLQLRGFSEDEVERRVHEALEICGLYPFRNWPIAALSYGQKKRVTIASILVLQPEVLLLDEPTAGQDYRHFTEMMHFLQNLQQRGIAVVIITHDMHLMLEYANRAVVMVEGKIIFEGDPLDVLLNEELIEQAYLKETSLFQLAEKVGLENPKQCVEAFVAEERKRRLLWQKNY